MIEVPHACHAKGCAEAVPPSVFMCRPHWRQVPSMIQQDLQRHYRKGQEKDKRPSRYYVNAARAAIEVVAAI